MLPLVVIEVYEDIAYTNSGALEKNGSGGFFVSFGFNFLFRALNKRIPEARPSARRLAAKSLIAAVPSTSGDFVRWESSSEGSNRRCKSLAAKALSAAANSIKILITISFRFTL